MKMKMDKEDKVEDEEVTKENILKTLVIHKSIEKKEETRIKINNLAIK